MNKIQLKEHIEKIINYVSQEYNHGPKLIINESKKPIFISEGLYYHIENNLSINESIYRPQSMMFLKLFTEVRKLYEDKRLQLCEADQYYFDNTDIGNFGEYNGIKVPLDLPLTKDFLSEVLGGEFNVNKVWDFIESRSFNNPNYIPKFNTAEEIWNGWGPKEKEMYANFDWKNTYSNEIHPREKVNLQHRKNYDALAGLTEAKKKKDPPIGKPKRGGSKKFYVYVRNPKTKKVKKVSFGMAGGGLRAKLNNPKARHAFSNRHNCPQKKDKTKASYWSCHLPRYAKLLGFKTSFSGYW